MVQALSLPTTFAQPKPPVTTLNAASSTIATLLLQDGTAFNGISFGAEVSIAGECVFATGHAGYPESLTDPSYRGQILVLTFPLIGNYGVPSREAVDAALNNLQKYFESSQIHVAALVVGNYAQDYSHYLASSSLSEWLKEQNIPAIYGIDTRALTKKIRTTGALLGKLVFPKTASAAVDYTPADWLSSLADVAWHDPNTRNLVAEVSTKHSVVYAPDPSVALKGPDGKVIRVLAVDVGMKNNQIRCFVKKGVELKVVPWDYDFTADSDYDGLFISNGPGDPTTVTTTIAHVAKKLSDADKPVFGICLGHQILALASGASTKKMPFGNRGQNIPCTNLQTGRCYITSQNHGFEVDASTLPEGWEEFFVNANDGSNEGIIHKSLPFFSVQFHPESTPGPWDTEFLFDKFIDAIKASKEAGKAVALAPPEPRKPSQRVYPRKVVVLGSGGLSIGQAGEFDYSGSQAIKALKEENIYTILINPNIATIQTSAGLADKVYFLPVTPDFVRKVIKHEKPDGIYCTFGGQTALNVGVKLRDEFEGLGVKVLGTPIHTIEITEDRELFASSMEEIGERCAKSESAVSIQEAIDAANRIGYPLIIRAAYTLGGLGSGFANNEEELVEICTRAFHSSPQVLVEKSMKGWKEVEYEVVRDAYDNCITVCNMENFDPLGIHTGDSIVVAPSQTLSDEDYMMLRRTAVNVIRHLGVVGECNIQYALNPHSKEYCIIEVNARLSRSSALASKATGYPLAFVAAKLGLGIPLTEVKNSVTKKTIACFEPSLDYIVVKIPRWDLKKFNRVSTKISSAMKSVGEVMAIGRSFEEAIQDAIRSVEYSFTGFSPNEFITNLDEELANPSDQRLFAIANAFQKGYSVDQIHKLTNIDRWFLNKLKNISDMDARLSAFTATSLPTNVLRAAKQIGFSDRQIAKATQTTELAIREIRKEAGITPFVKQIDTVAAEFPCYTNYLYMTYNASEHDVEFDDKGVVVLGSGVYRIGSSVEFDWCAVRCIRTLRGLGVKTVMINYNPETVSTDYDEADRLYFETLTLERVLDIYEVEQSQGVILSMGGQTPNNIALPLQRENVNIIGTSPEMIDNAENRYKFSRMLDKIGVDQPLWKELTSIDEARTFCEKVNYPVLVRPSYVLSGAAMNVVYSEADLKNFLDLATNVSPEFPVVITKFIEEAKEIELDAVAKDGKLVMHVISEHVENAGVHSGDATLVLPPQDLDPETVRKIEYATRKIAHALHVTGPMNIQFIAKNNEIKVIECNLRASRSFPFVSKVMGVDMIEMATKAMIDRPFEAYPTHELPKDYVGVKVPQFSFARLSGADPVLGVEMASTGEVACFGRDKYEAYIKALLSTGFRMPKKNILLSMGSFKEKIEFLPSVRKLHQLGYNLFATSGTADFIQEHGIPVKYLEALEDEANVSAQKLEYSLTQHLGNSMIDLYINLPSKNRYRRPASYMSKGYRTRRMAVDFAVPLITNIKCAKLFVEALSRNATEFDVHQNDFKTSHQTLTLPGLINVQSFLPSVAHPSSTDFKSVTRAAVAGGFTLLCNSPLGVGGNVSDRKTVNLAQANCRAEPFTDYLLSIVATQDNLSQMASVSQDVSSLFLNFRDDGVTLNNMVQLTNHIHQWPADGILITNATDADLATVLLLGSLHERKVHVTEVKTKNDIHLITMSKEKGVAVTCDVSVYNLFLSNKDIPSESLGTPEDVQALWDNIASIDCFSVGTVPYNVTMDAGKKASAASGLEDALPLLLTAVQEGRLALDDIVTRLYDNPRRIFELPEQPDTYIEVELDRKYVVPAQGFQNAQGEWSPLAGRTLRGTLHRVVFRGQTVFLDGSLFGEAIGRDVTSLARILSKNAPHAATSTRRSDVKSPRVRGSILGDAALGTVRSPSTEITALGNLMKGSSAGNLAEEESKEGQLVKALRQQQQQGVEAPSSISSRSPFFRKHILSVQQFNRNELHMLFGVAQEMRNLVERYGGTNILQGRVMCSAFYEPSTRTSSSFETAMVRLGGQVVSINSITSSIAKGESIGDTVRTLGCYGDIIVMRHPEQGAVSLAAKHSQVPIINAGDGIGEHPTQAFLDTFTIREELGTVNGLTVTMVGDLKNGRTVHSLVKLLSQYDVKFNFVAPECLRIPDEVKEIAIKNKSQIYETTSLDDVIGATDVLYVTRIQKERFASEEEYKQVFGSYVITNKVLRNAKSHMIVMHPLPRINEIDAEVDYDQRAAYFRQMRYGLYVRMALIALVCGKSL
ncbi:uncharacterized protein BJ171DRAFT_612621 [Polychytrium aggregatum]|uniref:uncharacterized protein n=1 Tax=Polychytrium aggregatum TaxID=110093 RepID=UPI0022FEBEDE|nr:uncharacterized protein BJ171DRAFT_612621 [Polychytrium aggregatum]KAI9206090.1 hypothetical protein BJ171DRAFT_612621 [Polychytrium aggregatum]